MVQNVSQTQTIYALTDFVMYFYKIFILKIEENILRIKFKNIGCDMVLNSNATEDMCGVCQGDNSTCTINNKTILFSTRYHKYGKHYF
jgi:hypothetical protein